MGVVAYTAGDRRAQARQSSVLGRWEGQGGGGEGSAGGMGQGEAVDRIQVHGRELDTCPLIGRGKTHRDQDRAGGWVFCALLAMHPGVPPDHADVASTQAGEHFLVSLHKHCVRGA